MKSVWSAAFSAAALASVLTLGTVTYYGWTTLRLERDAFRSEVSVLSAKVDELLLKEASHEQSIRRLQGPQEAEPAAPAMGGFLTKPNSQNVEGLKIVQLADIPHPMARRLGGFIGVAAQGSTAANTGCVTIASTLTITVSGKNCNSLACPYCYLMSGATAYTLTLAGCSTAYLGQASQLGGASPLDNFAIEYVFVNVGSNTFSVTDGNSNTKNVAAGTVSKAWCSAAAIGATANTLYWDAIAT